MLILGTGSVSLFALQFAKAAGAQVIATSSSDEKFERLQRLGADAVINYKAESNWGRKAKYLTDGRGVDHVIEVGGAGTLPQSIVACRTGGQSAHRGNVVESNSHQRTFRWKQSRSRGHDSSHNGQSVEAYYRPPVSAAGHCRCVQVLRIPKALWQGLSRNLGIDHQMTTALNVVRA